ncbi:MAG: hypothetical protein K0A99_08130 [Desulfoarculaceae bacterium]|nr:hypothetical protein [Desulfoarculaceae bacterium]
MKRLLIILISFVLLIGCSAARFTINESVDPVTSQKVFYTSGNYLDPEHSFLLSLNIQVDDKDTPKQKIFLVLEYSWAGWAFIKAGESLIFNVDGEVIKFDSDEGSANQRDVNTGKYVINTVTEYAMYNFDRKKMEKIIAGKNVIGKVVGSKFELPFTVTPTNQNNFKTMLEAIKD